MKETRIWYREPWVWLIIALPMSAVIGGMITIYLAITSNDGLVEDDYYERGKTINRVLARDEAAARYQLQAIVGIDSQSGQVTMTLESSNYLHPEHVNLLLLHPTRAGHDQQVRLELSGEGTYIGSIRLTVTAYWHVRLETDDWRLSGRMQLPQEKTLKLMPRNTDTSNGIPGQSGDNP